MSDVSHSYLYFMTSHELQFFGGAGFCTQFRYALISIIWTLPNTDLCLQNKIPINRMMSSCNTSGWYLSSSPASSLTGRAVEFLNRYRHILIPEYGQKAQISGTHPVVRQFILEGVFVFWSLNFWLMIVPWFVGFEAAIYVISNVMNMDGKMLCISLVRNILYLYCVGYQFCQLYFRV